jgi:site-specific DNA recombinase
MCVTQLGEQRLQPVLNDLAVVDVADGTLPAAKIRAKLNEIKVDRARVEAGLTNTTEQLSIGAGVLRDALQLVSSPDDHYRHGSNEIRKYLNETFFELF